MRTMVVLGLALGGCSSSDDDSRSTDAGPLSDVGATDAGRERGICPKFNNPECNQQDACGELRAPEPSCTGCRPFSPEFTCDFGECRNLTPPGNIHQIGFSVGALRNRFKSFTATLVSQTTAGGATITCEDVYADQIDLDDGCYNVVQSQGKDSDQQETEFFPFYSGTPSGKVLIILWGYAEEVHQQTDPVGISCTPAEIGADGLPGCSHAPASPCLEGDRMRLIQ